MEQIAGGFGIELEAFFVFHWQENIGKVHNGHAYHVRDTLLNISHLIMRDRMLETNKISF